MCDGTPRCENPRPTWPGRGFSSFPTEDGMGNYSSGARRPATGSSPVRRTAPARTHEGGAGRARDAKSELYLTAVSTMVGEGNAYESGDARLERMRELVAAVVDADPQWLAGVIPWLRSGGPRCWPTGARPTAGRCRTDCGAVSPMPRSGCTPSARR